MLLYDIIIHNKHGKENMASARCIVLRRFRVPVIASCIWPVNRAKDEPAESGP
jgi:hypothetical protein